MNSVVESVSQAIVSKFMNNPNLMDKLTQKVVQSGVLLSNGANSDIEIYSLI